jgi:hypothetical protein
VFQPGRGPWPVVFRPLRGEILYSWLARTAGLYDQAPEELLPAEKGGFLHVLVNGHSASALKHLGVLMSMFSIRENRPYPQPADLDIHSGLSRGTIYSDIVRIVLYS